MITAGQRLRLSGWHPDPPRWLEHAALGAIPAAPASGYVGRHRNEATYASAPAASPATVSLGGYSGFQQCVITRESGGNAQVMNSTGHYGLYQFSYSTWVAYGGSGADFGHASVAEQNQVFSNAMATPGGANNWAPYDGC
jgi:hypothetical protein